MTWFADMTPCTYFPYRTDLIAVGWLDSAEPYVRGEPSAAFLTKLKELLKDPWEPGAFAGLHECNLCPENRPPPRGNRNLMLADGDWIFVAPAMILHYISDHGYMPPASFTAAVQSAPPMRSREYFAQLERAARVGVVPQDPNGHPCSSLHELIVEFGVRIKRP